MSHLTIEPGSPAMEWLQRKIGLDDRTIRITEARTGLQFKWGEGTWTTPLSTKAPDHDVRELRRADCTHLVCKRCKGHDDYHEADADHEGGDRPYSCLCCKHCGGNSH